MHIDFMKEIIDVPLLSKKQANKIEGGFNVQEKFQAAKVSDGKFNAQCNNQIKNTWEIRACDQEVINIYEHKQRCGLLSVEK